MFEAKQSPYLATKTVITCMHVHTYSTFPAPIESQNKHPLNSILHTNMKLISTGSFKSACESPDCVPTWLDIMDDLGTSVLPLETL